MCIPSYEVCHVVHLYTKGIDLVSPVEALKVGVFL